MKKKQESLNDIFRNFNRAVKEELGYPSIASNHPIDVTGLGPVQSEVPPSFQGKLEIGDAVETLFHHFSISQILDTIVNHLVVKAQGAGETGGTEPEEIQNMLDSVSDLKKVADKLR
jgi:hypothetical protein